MLKLMFKSLFVFIFLTVFFASTYSINAANEIRIFNPFLSGNPIGEPIADLSSVVIEKESLTLDLRNLVNFHRNQILEFTSEHSPRLVTIETIYQVRNDKEEQAISLTFFADTMSFSSNNTGVWLNDQAITDFSFDPTEKDLPINWGIPNNTPSIDGTWLVAYRPQLKSGSIRFNLSIPTGTHKIRVCYLAQPTTYLQGDETIPWQIVYSLTQTRDWVGFKSLDATIYIPKGWQFASNNKLNNEDGKLTATWLTPPSNSLALTVQTPIPRFFKTSFLAWLLSPILCLLLGKLIGKLLYQYKQTLILSIPISISLGAIWALSIYFSMTYDQDHLKFLVGENQLTRPSGSFIKIATLPIAFALGFVLTQATAFFSHRNIVEKKT